MEKLRSLVTIGILLFVISFLVSCKTNVDSFFSTTNVPIQDQTEAEFGKVGNSALDIEPLIWEFDPLYVGSTASKTFTVTNKARVGVYIHSITSSHVSFQIDAHTCNLSPHVFSSEQTCDVTVTFDPQTSGNFSGSIVVKYGSIASENNLASFNSLTGLGASALNFDGITLIDQVKCTTVVAHWTHVAGAISYLVYKETGAGDVFVGATNAPNDSLTLTSLSPGTNYTLKVQAVDALGAITSTTETQSTSTVPAPVLTDITDYSFPNNELIQQQPLTPSVDIDNTLTSSDADMSYTCYFDQIVDDTVAASTACTDLKGTPTFNSTNGQFAWTPNTLVVGPYEIKITGTRFSQSSATSIFVIDVRPDYSTTNLLYDLDAQFANSVNIHANPAALDIWKNIFTTGANFDGTLSSTTWSTGWVGDGLWSNPFRLAFNSADSDHVAMGTELNSEDEFMFSGWFKLGDPTQLGQVILGNGGGDGNGFVLKQSAETASKLQFLVGNVASTNYQNAVISKGPVGHWRLNEPSGTAVADTSGSSNNGTASAAVAFGSAGGVEGDTSATFNGTTTYVDVANSASLNFTTGGLTILAWIYPTSDNGNWRTILGKGISPYQYLFALHQTTKKPSFYGTDATGSTWNESATTVPPLNQWSFVSVTYNSMNNELRYYYNGQPDGNTTIGNGTFSSTASGVEIGTMINHGYGFIGRLSNVSLFNKVLLPAEVAAIYAENAPNCETASTLNNSTWYNLAGFFESSSGLTRLYVNNNLECSTTFTGSFAGSTALTLGAKADTTQAWSGAVADLKIYSEGDGTAVTNLYNQTRNRYRDVGAIDQLGLALHLDARLNNGTTFAGTGCAQTSWVDLSDSNLTATLNNFSGCGATTGWNGTGLSTDPYRLTFDGAAAAPNDDYVSIPDNAALDITGAISIMLWMKPTSNANYQGFVAKGASPYAYLFAFDSGTLKQSLYMSTANETWANRATTGATLNQWNHVGVTFNGTTKALKYYTNGQPDGTFVTASGTMINSADILEIGNMIGNAYPFTGSISSVLIYNRDLTAEEVQNNCTAEAHFFDGADCDP